jgi:hypothetical protein
MLEKSLKQEEQCDSHININKDENNRIRFAAWGILKCICILKFHVTVELYSM